MKSIKMNFSRVQTTHVSRVQTTPFSRVQTTPRPQSAEEKTACLKQVVNLVFPFQALNLHFRARIPLGRPEAGPEPDLQTGCVRIQYSPFGARIPLSGPEAVRGPNPPFGARSRSGPESPFRGPKPGLNQN
jgi:hypothetical protein